MFRNRFGMIMFDEDGGAGGAAPEPTVAQSAEPAAPAAEPTAEPPAFAPHAYMAQAKGELKTDEFFKDYGDITSVMEGLKESRKKIAELEEKTKTPEITTPKSANEYKLLDKSELGGIELKKEEIEGLQNAALALSATQEQFEALLKGKAEEKKQQDEFRLERREATVKYLQEKWTTESDYKEGWERYNAATTGLEKMGIAGVKELMKKPEYGDNGVIIQIISEFGRFFQDDAFFDGKGGVVPGKQTGQLSYKNME